MQGQAQATIVARVAYVLLHTFILSTVFRCKSEVDGSWISHIAYVAGFCAALLVSNALYITLTVMDPGYIPAVQGLKLQVSSHTSLFTPGSRSHEVCSVPAQWLACIAALDNVQGQSQDELGAQQSRDGEGSHITSTARSSLHGSAAAPAFDFEGLLHGAAWLPSTNSLPLAASSSNSEPARTVTEDGSAAALQKGSTNMDWMEHSPESSVSHLRSLEVRPLLWSSVTPYGIMSQMSFTHSLVLGGALRTGLEAEREQYGICSWNDMHTLVQEGLGWRPQESVNAGSAPSHISSLACKQEQQPVQPMSLKGKPSYLSP